MILFSRAFIRKRMISIAATASVTATSFALVEDPARTDHSHGATPIRYVADRSDQSDMQLFLSDNTAMMADMTIKPTGDVVAPMVPHDQGAVDMANADFKFGLNKQAASPAGSADFGNQHQEIMAMQDALADGQSSAAGPSELAHAPLTSRSARNYGSDRL
jgi:uncharacterized protein (DUF305 family)